MTISKRLARQTLEALEIGHQYAHDCAERFHIEIAGYKQKRHETMDAEVRQIADSIAALRQALEQQKQKPVTLLWLAEIIMSDCGCRTKNQPLLELIIARIKQYEHANTPARQDPLTDEQICQMADATPVDEISCAADTWHIRFARAIEAAHGITGDVK